MKNKPFGGTLIQKIVLFLGLLLFAYSLGQTLDGFKQKNCCHENLK